MTLENQLKLTVQIKSEDLKMEIVLSVAQQSELTFLTEINALLVTTKTMVTNQKPLTFCSHQLLESLESLSGISNNQETEIHWELCSKRSVTLTKLESLTQFSTKQEKSRVASMKQQAFVHLWQLSRCITTSTENLNDLEDFNEAKKMLMKLSSYIKKD